MLRAEATCSKTRDDQTVKNLVQAFEDMSKVKDRTCDVQEKDSLESLIGRVAATRAIFEEVEPETLVPESAGDWPNELGIDELEQSEDKLMIEMQDDPQAEIQQNKMKENLQFKKQMQSVPDSVLDSIISDVETAIELKYCNKTLLLGTTISFGGFQLSNEAIEDPDKTKSCNW